MREKKNDKQQTSLTEATPLGPRWDSAPPRISHRVRFQGGRRRREKFIHLISYSKENIPEFEEIFKGNLKKQILIARKFKENMKIRKSLIKC